MVPYVASTVSTACLHAFGSVNSASTANALPPLAITASTASLLSAALRPMIQTVAPSFANTLAMP